MVKEELSQINDLQPGMDNYELTCGWPFLPGEENPSNSGLEFPHRSTGSSGNSPLFH